MQKVKSFLIQLLAAIPILLMLTGAARQAHADTRVIQQMAYDAARLGRWGQFFTLSGSTTIQSIAIGGRNAAASCGDLQIFTPDLVQGNWKYAGYALGSPTDIVGGSVYTGNFVLGAGTWLLMTETNGSTCFSTMSTLDNVLFPPTSTFGAASFSNDGNGNKYGTPTNQLQFSICSDATCTLDGGYFFSSTSTPFDIHTHFVAMLPDDNQTIATTTAYDFSATTYIPDNERVSGEYLHVEVSQNQKQNDFFAADIFDAVGQNVGTVYDEIIGTGSFEVTHHDVPITLAGRYTVKWSIRKPQGTLGSVLSFFGLSNLTGSNIIVASTTSFIADHTTLFDNYIASTTEAIASSTNKIKPFNAAVCGFSNFDFTQCIGLVFGWSPFAMGLSLKAFTDTVLVYAPFGYVTRTLSILSNDATTTPADLTFSLGHYPIAAISDSSFALPIWESLASGQQALDNATSTTQEGLTMRQIVEPWLLKFLALTALIVILTDLGILGARAVQESGGSRLMGRKGKKGGITADEYRYKETLYKIKDRK